MKKGLRGYAQFTLSPGTFKVREGRLRAHASALKRVNMITDGSSNTTDVEA
jgi:hypothetical protein